MHCTFNQKWRKFCIDDVISPWKCWFKVTKLAPERVLMQAYPTPPSLVFLVFFSGNWYNRGAVYAPSRACNSQTLSSERVNVWHACWCHKIPSPICLSLGARPNKAIPCTFNQKWRKFCIDGAILPWKCWSKVTAFAPERVVMRAYSPPSLVFLALLGAEIAGGIICPLSRAFNSQTLSSARVDRQIVAGTSTSNGRWQKDLDWGHTYRKWS